jgi:hypothetical protein
VYSMVKAISTEKGLRFVIFLFFNRKGFRVCDLFTNLCIKTHFAVFSGRLFRDLLTTIIKNSKKSVSNHFIIEIDIRKI